MKVRRLLVWLLVAGCASARTVVAPEPHQAAEMVPAGEPVVRYADGAPPVPSSAVLDAMGALVRESAVASGREPPLADGRLYAVAADLAGFLGQERPPYEVIEFALSYHGIVEPTPHLELYYMNGGDLATLSQGARERLAALFRETAYARVGVGVADGENGLTKVVIALQEPGVDIEPFPRELPRGGAHRLRGRVLPPWRDPHVYVTAPGGEVAEAPTVRDGASFRADVRCDAEGKLKVEVVAEDARGDSSVRANFAVYCGVAPPRRMVVGAPEPPPADAAEVEAALLELTNRDRRAAGLAALAPDDYAAAVARAHSQEMRDTGVVTHVSPTQGDLGARIKRAGLVTPLALENVARSSSAREAHQNLMDSPGHRANLLSPKATHVGIGVALGDEVSGQREVYVTEVFIRKGPAIDVVEARVEAARALGAARAAAKAPPATEDPALTRIAQAYASGLAAGQPDAVLSARAGAELDRLSEPYSRVVTEINVVMEVREAIREAAVDPRARAFGIGLAQGRHPEMGEGALFVVTLMAQIR